MGSLTNAVLASLESHSVIAVLCFLYVSGIQNDPETEEPPKLSPVAMPVVPPFVSTEK